MSELSGEFIYRSLMILLSIFLLVVSFQNVMNYIDLQNSENYISKFDVKTLIVFNIILGVLSLFFLITNSIAWILIFFGKYPKNNPLPDFPGFNEETKLNIEEMLINTLIEKAYTGGEDGKGYLDNIEDQSRFKDFYDKAKLVLVSDFEFEDNEVDKQKVKDALEKLNEISPGSITVQVNNDSTAQNIINSKNEANGLNSEFLKKLTKAITDKFHEKFNGVIPPVPAGGAAAPAPVPAGVAPVPAAAPVGGLPQIKKNEIFKETINEVVKSKADEIYRYMGISKSKALELSKLFIVENLEKEKANGNIKFKEYLYTDKYKKAKDQIKELGKENIKLNTELTRLQSKKAAVESSLKNKQNRITSVGETNPTRKEELERDKTKLEQMKTQIDANIKYLNDETEEEGLPKGIIPKNKKIIEDKTAEIKALDKPENIIPIKFSEFKQLVRARELGFMESLKMNGIYLFDKFYPERGDIQDIQNVSLYKINPKNSEYL